MRTVCRVGVVLLTLGLAGCLGDEAGRDPFALRNPFKSDRKADPSTAPAASARAATRVHTIGNSIIAANGSEMRTKPVFLTIGLPEPMIFHRRAGDIIVSEGLVERCTTDAELAAVLCNEIGKLAAERDERASPKPETDLPPAPRLSADVVGSGQPADMTHLAEQATYDRRNPRPARGPREARPDPRSLAQNFLSKAGHRTEDLERMTPLIKEAEENAEKREIMRGR